ncbi:MAG: hypothetical protein GY772_28420, partial [bacterium]|nr:hypothetical protein [bacterium]
MVGPSLPLGGTLSPLHRKRKSCDFRIGGSKADYRDLIDRCVKATKLARKPLDAVQPSDVRRWMSDLARRKVGLRTRQRVLALLRTALGAAEREHTLLYNPAAKVETPKAAKRKVCVTLDREHVGALLEAAEGNAYEATVVLAALHGLRIGEV